MAFRHLLIHSDKVEGNRDSESQFTTFFSPELQNNWTKALAG